MKPIGIPPLAGLATHAQAARPGLSVEENVERLRRYNFIKTRLYQVSAAFMNPTPEWEVKSALSLHLWLDAEHSKAFRERAAELRKPPLFLDKPPSPMLEAAMNELLCARTTLELLVGVYGVVRPALLAEMKAHLAENNPLFDHPTCRALRIAIEEEEQMVAWAHAALEALLTDDQAHAEADAWEAHVQAFWSDDNPPTPRWTPDWKPNTDPQRDWRSREIYNFHYRANDVYLDEGAPYDERNLALMFKRFHEMDVPEMMASIVLETHGKPWEFYRDLARQIWDECRHALMGEVWFALKGIDMTRYPNHVGWSMHLNLDRTPLERHIILFAIEQSLMDGRVGKKLEWEIAQAAGDPLATYFQDYDWADEVLHAQIGRRWLKPQVGEVKEILERAREIAARPTSTFEARAQTTPQEDWWPRFVQDALGKPSVSKAGIESGLIPTIVSASG